MRKLAVVAVLAMLAGVAYAGTYTNVSTVANAGDFNVPTATAGIPLKGPKGEPVTTITVTTCAQSNATCVADGGGLACNSLFGPGRVHMWVQNCGDLRWGRLQTEDILAYADGGFDQRCVSKGITNVPAGCRFTATPNGFTQNDGGSILTQVVSGTY